MSVITTYAVLLLPVHQTPTTFYIPPGHRGIAVKKSTGVCPWQVANVNPTTNTALQLSAV